MKSIQNKHLRHNLVFPILTLIGLIFSEYGYSKQYKFIMLGDSLTAGYGVGKEASFPTLAENLLKEKGFEISLINGGISGSTTASAESRLKWMIGSKPTHLFLALGANDGLRGFDLKVTEKNLDKTISFAKKNGLIVMLAGMKIPPNYGKEYTNKFEAIFKNLSEKHSVAFMPFLLDEVAGVPNLNLPDGIHPNEKGHLIIAKNVATFIEKQIKQENK